LGKIPRVAKEGDTVKSCAEYYELISAYIDNELDEEDRLIVERHIESCPDCCGLLRAYSGISKMVEDMAAPAPESIRRRVMAEITKPAVVNPKTRRFTLPRAAAALVPLAAGILLFFVLRSDSALLIMPDNETAYVQSAEFSMALPDTAPGSVAPELEETADWAAPQTAAAPPALMADDADEPRAGAGFSDEDNAEANLLNEFYYGEAYAGFYAIVFIDGDIPPALAGIDPYVTDCGNLFAIIPREMVAELIGYPDVLVEFRNKEAEYAKVMF